MLLHLQSLKKTESLNQVDFRNNLKKRTAAEPVVKEKEKESESKVDFRNLLKKKSEET